MKRYEISNREWERIKDKLPAERTDKRGRPAKNNRIMLNGMLWIARTGAQWREMPECYGPWQSVYARFRKWQKDGVWEKIFHTLSSDADCSLPSKTQKSDTQNAKNRSDSSDLREPERFFLCNIIF